MKKFLKSLRRQDGFTLVELMVVVAIIGLLSAVAIPNFKKYQAKAKASEAKLQLAALYTAMQSWYSDYDNYASCLVQMGYDPSSETSSRYYAVGFVGGTYGVNASSVNNNSPACPNSTIGVDGVSATDASAFGAGKQVNSVKATSTQFTSAATGVTMAVNSGNFLAAASGPIDASASAMTTCSSFSINQNKNIVQVRLGY